jgi:hypothetical protein
VIDKTKDSKITSSETTNAAQIAIPLKLSEVCLDGFFCPLRMSNAANENEHHEQFVGLPVKTLPTKES